MASQLYALQIRMEYNKDESIRCLELANTYLTKGDRGKALKFASKSEKLYPSDNAKGEIFDEL